LKGHGKCESKALFLSKAEIAGEQSAALDPWMSVEIEIKKVADDPGHIWTRYQNVERASLTLIDYVYFAIYTITTTGYGDIIPVTTYAKFLSTMANICELFFIVIFFNILLTTKPPRPPLPVVMREIVERIVGDKVNRAATTYTETSTASAERILNRIGTLEVRLQEIMGQIGQAEEPQAGTTEGEDTQEGENE
jgi:hypothetical protein